MTPSRQHWTLAAACLAQFVILLDMTIVNVALPSIQEELGVSQGNLEWIVNAYVIALATLILVGGGLGDRYGRKRFFALGFALFTVFSAACALASDDPELIAFRALQGVGAALLAPLALSIIVDAFPQERRAFAIGIWAGVASIGFGLGPIIGGLLIEWFDWSSVFWVNVPMGVAGVVVTLLFVRESRDPRERRLDLVGALLVAFGLFCVTFALVETDDHAWLSPFTLGFLALGGALLVGFVLYESRHPEPMLPLGFFRDRRFAFANLTYALLYAAFAGVFFLITLYLQNVRDFSALETAFAFLLLNVPFGIVALVNGRLQRRFGPLVVVLAGTLFCAVGMLALAAYEVNSSLAVVLLPYVPIGVGFALATPAISTVAMAAVSPDRAGVASGVLNSARQVGAAMGLAALGAISVEVAARSGDPGSSSAFVSGFKAAMLVAGALALVGTAATLLGSRRRRQG